MLCGSSHQSAPSKLNAVFCVFASSARAWLVGKEDVGWTPTRVSDSQRYAYDDVRTVVGQSTIPGEADGNETVARLNAPAAVEIHNATRCPPSHGSTVFCLCSRLVLWVRSEPQLSSRSLFVAEHGNHAIRMVTIHNPTVAWKGKDA